MLVAKSRNSICKRQGNNNKWARNVQLDSQQLEILGDVLLSKYQHLILISAEASDGRRRTNDEKVWRGRVAGRWANTASGGVRVRKYGQRRRLST